MAKIILILVFVLIVATFSTLNQQEISLRYFFGWETVPFPLFLLILASLILGLILGKRVNALREEIATLSKKPEPPEPPSPPPEAEKAPGA